MQKKFKVLRFIGTIWKVLAWIKLILGILAAIGILLIGVLGGGMLEQAGQQVGLDTTGMPLAAGIVGGVAGFVVVSIASVVAFFVLYAVGELVYLALAVEENSRSASLGMAAWMQQQQQAYAAPAPQAYPAAPAYPPPQVFAPPPDDYLQPPAPTPLPSSKSAPSSATAQIQR